MNNIIYKKANFKSLVKAKRREKKGEYKKEKGKDSNNNNNRKGRRSRGEKWCGRQNLFVSKTKGPLNPTLF